MGATTCRSLPYPDPTDVFTQIRLHVEALAEALDVDLCELFESKWSTGDLKQTLATAAPDGWVMMGTSIPNANVGPTAALFALLPASMKVGTTLNLPPMDGRVLMGGGTLGAVGGSNSASLVAANLPPHLHTVNITTGGDNNSHTHPINHDHPNFVAPLSITVTTAVRDNSTPGATQSLMTASGSGASNIQEDNPTAEGTASVNVPNYSGSSGVQSGPHTHNVAGGTGNGPGTSEAINITPAHLRVNVMVKL